MLAWFLTCVWCQKMKSYVCTVSFKGVHQTHDISKALTVITYLSKVPLPWAWIGLGSDKYTSTLSKHIFFNFSCVFHVHVIILKVK